MPHGSFSLAAQLCLLAWDPDTGRPTDAPQLHWLVRAGALTELVQRGLLTDTGGVVRPDDDARTGDPALDDLLELISESRPHGWRGWVTRHAGLTLDAVRAGLADAGCLRAEPKRLLRLLPPKDYALERVPALLALRADALSVLHGRHPAAEVAPRDAALIALAAAGGLRTVVSDADRVAYGERIAELAARSEQQEASPGGGAGAAGNAESAGNAVAEEAQAVVGARAVGGMPAVAEVRAGLADAVAAGAGPVPGG